MAIESASFLSQLDSANPKGTDQRSTLDDHARLIKKSAKQTLPNLDSTVSATPGALNLTIGLTSNAQQQINAALSAVAAVSASLLTQTAALSASLQTQLNTVDTNISNEIASVSAVLQGQFLGISGTAVNALNWDGGLKYVQTATPSLGVNDVWFEPET